MAQSRSNSGGNTERTPVPQLTPHQQTILEEAARKINVRTDGSSQETTVAAALWKKYEQVALSGSPHALGRVTAEIIAAQKIKQIQNERDVLFGRKLKQVQQKLLERVTKAELDPNQVLPHPDDITIIEGVGYRVDGPWVAEEVDLILQLCAKRDVLLQQSVLEDRLATPEDPRDGSTALVLAHFLNRGLPKRFYMSQDSMMMKLMRLESQTKRELLKTVRDAWKSIGVVRPRGYRMVTLSVIKSQIKRLESLIDQIITQYPTVSHLHDDEIAAHLQRLLVDFLERYRPELRAG